MLPTLYGMPAAEMGNSVKKGRLVAGVIGSPDEDGPRRMAIEAAIMGVRGKSSNQVRSTFVPEAAAPLVEGRATTRTQLLAMRRAELEAANAHVGRDRQTSLPKGVHSPAPPASDPMQDGSRTMRCSWAARQTAGRTCSRLSSLGTTRDHALGRQSWRAHIRPGARDYMRRPEAEILSHAHAGAGQSMGQARNGCGKIRSTSSFERVTNVRTLR